MLVAGEAGVGKSRLVAEIAREAEARGMRELTGHCVEMSGAPPYLPYVEMIEQAVSNPRNPLVLRNALVGVAPEIARIAPALRRVLPDIPPPVELPPELAQRYVWNSVGEFVTAARRGCRCCWCSKTCTGPTSDGAADRVPGAAAARHARAGARHVPGHRGGCLTPAGAGHRRARAPAAGRTDRPAGALPDGVRAMVEALAGQPVPERVVRLIEMETEGNPFFIEEVYLHLAESGVLFDEQGRVHRDLVGRELRTGRYAAGAGERLARLSPSTREALTAAAILGRCSHPTWSARSPADGTR